MSVYCVFLVFFFFFGMLRPVANLTVFKLNASLGIKIVRLNIPIAKK